MTEATITGVDIYPVKEIAKFLKDWNTVGDYPVIVVHCGLLKPSRTQMQAQNKEYIVDILIQCADEDSEVVADNLELLVTRVEDKLLAHQRLDNLADNNNKEKVFDIEIEQIRFNDSGGAGFYFASAWIELIVRTDRIGPFR